MSKGFGSRADMLSTKFDEVSRNSIWREHCEKEQAMAGLDQDRDFVITNPHSSTCPVVCSLPRERGARRSRARNAARCGACCRPRRAGGVLGVWLLRLRDQVGQGGRQGRAGDTPSRGERVPTARSVGFGSVSGVGVGNWLRLGPFSEAAPTPPTTRHVAARGVSGWAPCGTAIAPSPRLHQQPKEVTTSPRLTPCAFPAPAVTTIPEKPNNVKPQMKVSGDTIAKANETLRAMGAVAGLEDAKDGATEPLTSAQEYGFAHQPLVPRNPMFHHGRNTCNITDYAAQYYAMTKTTPFTRRDD